MDVRWFKHDVYFFGELPNMVILNNPLDFMEYFSPIKDIGENLAPVT